MVLLPIHTLPLDPSTLLGLQFRYGDKPFTFEVVCLRNGSAVLKRVKTRLGQNVSDRRGTSINRRTFFM